MVFSDQTYSVLVVSASAKFNESVRGLLPERFYWPVTVLTDAAGTRNFLFSTHLSILSRMVSQEMEKVQVWVVVVSTVVSCGSTGAGLPSGTGSVMY